MQQFLTADHNRLDELLTRTLTGTSSVDYGAWDEFRQGLLQHMAWEEKIAMPPLRATGTAGELCDRIRADHALLAALTVPPPRAELILTTRRVLEEHNKLEEAPGGLYEQCVQAAAGEDLLARIRVMPAVPVSPPRSGPEIEAHITRLLRARQR